MVPPPGSRGPGGPGSGAGGAGASDPGHSKDPSRDRSVRCEASRNLKWSITNTGINAPVYKLTLPNPDAPGHEQPLFQISKPNPNAPHWTMFYFTYAGHLIPPKRIEFGKIQKNATQGSRGGGGTRVTITGKTPDEKAVWQTLGEGNEDMVEWIVLCAALNVLDEEIIKAAEKNAGRESSSSGAATARDAVVPSSRPMAVGSSPSKATTVLATAPPRGPVGGPSSGKSPQMSHGSSPPMATTRPGPTPYGPSAAAASTPIPSRSYSDPRTGAGPSDPRGFPQAQQHVRPPGPTPYGPSAAAALSHVPPRSYSDPRAGVAPPDLRGLPQAQQHVRPPGPGRYPFQHPHGGMPAPQQQGQQIGFARPPPLSSYGSNGAAYTGPPASQGYSGVPGSQGPPMGFRPPPQGYRLSPQAQASGPHPIRKF